MNVDPTRNGVLIGMMCAALAFAAVLEVRAHDDKPRVTTFARRDCAGDGSAASELFCTGKLPVNTATEGDLTRIRGIGPARAKAIVLHRNTHGPYRSSRDLERVEGIGPTTAAELAEVLVFR